MPCRRIISAVENVEILSPLSWSFGGREPLQAGVTDPAASFYDSSPLAVHIANALYFNCYAVPFDPSQFLVVDDFIPHGDPDFQRELSAANQSRARWQPGWRICPSASDGGIRLQRGTSIRAPRPLDVYYPRPAGANTPASQAMLRIERESFDRQTVFYYLYGETLADQFSEFDRVRFYFHCEAAGAPRLIRFLSRQLNEFRIPFQMKCLNNPCAYRRTDGAVLYLRRQHFQIGARIVCAAADELAAWFKPEVPLFSRELVPGVGMADDPGAKDSFGTSRCRMLAEGLIDAWCSGATSTDDRLQFVADRFASLGFDLEQPWLGAYAENIYDDAAEFGATLS